jgi:hypothetical protein
MVAAMLIMLAACWLYSVAVVLMRVRCIILERERNTGWLTGAVAHRNAPHFTGVESL